MCYVCQLRKVAREVWRVLRDDGMFWLNLGDSYASTTRGNNKGVGASTLKDGRGGYAYDAKVNQPTRRVELGDGLKPKDLCLIPARVALALQADGWTVRSVSPWVKRNPMPESCEDRPTVAHEDIFLLTKSNRTQFWTHPRKRGTRKHPAPDYVWQHKATGLEVAYPPLRNAKLLRRLWKRRNLWRGSDYFYDGDGVREAHNDNSIERVASSPGTGSGLSFGTNGERYARVEQVTLNPNGRNRRTSDWYLDSLRAHLDDGGLLTDPDGLPVGFLLATEPTPFAHFATWPQALVEPMIKAGTSERGCCPMCGAAWQRITEPTGHVNRREPAHVPGNSETKVDSTGWAPTTRPTNRWQPTCDCQPVLPPVPCLVLDPFAGAGTTGIVARNLGRRFVGLDLSLPYLRDIAATRLSVEFGRELPKAAGNGKDVELTPMEQWLGVDLTREAAP